VIGSQLVWYCPFQTCTSYRDEVWLTAASLITFVLFSLHFRIMVRNYQYIFTCLCDCRKILGWWSDLMHILIQRVTTIYVSLLHTH
jgi:hypothetical protein